MSNILPAFRFYDLKNGSLIASTAEILDFGSYFNIFAINSLADVETTLHS